MPQPTQQVVHVDRPLTNISVAYLQDDNDYIADKVFPVVPVQKQSDRYFVYNRGDFFRDVAQIRAAGTESAGGGYNLDNTPSYFCDVYAYHKDVDPQVRANSDQPLDADRDATIWVTQILAIKREVVFLANYFTTGKWTGSTTAGDITPGTKWDVTNSTPIEDIEAQQFSIKKLTGKWANRLVLGPNVYKALKNHDEFLQRIKYTQRGVVTPDIMASVLAPPNQPEASSAGDFKVLVAAAIKNTAAEGQTDSMAFAATATDALLTYANPNPGILQVSAGYIFTWVPIGGYIARIKQIAMPWLGTDNDGQPTMRVEGEMTLACKQVATDAGVYFSLATS
jgi:hypothetical protein